MNRHTVFVAGKRFVLLSDDNNEYVQTLAQEVNSAINKISAENPALESRSCAILCALDYADDKNKEMDKNKSLSNNAKTILQQSDKHAKQIKELKEKLTEKDKTIEKLKEEIEKLKASQSVQSTKHSESKPISNKSDTHTQKSLKKPQEKKFEKSNTKTSTVNKGYTPVRQYSLFEDEKD